MQKNRSKTEAEKCLAALKGALATLRNASQCVCDTCGGTITGAGFVDVQAEPIVWHEECLDNEPITDIHRSPERRLGGKGAKPGRIGMASTTRRSGDWPMTGWDTVTRNAGSGCAAPGLANTPQMGCRVPGRVTV